MNGVRGMVMGEGVAGQAIMSGKVERSAAVRPGSLLMRVFIGIVAALGAFSAAIYAVSVPLIKEKGYEIELAASRTVLDNVFIMAGEISGSLIDQRRRTVEAHEHLLRTVVDLAASYADGLRRQVTAGELSEDAARRQLFDGLRTFRYGANGYVWATDYNSVLQSHPEPRFQGMDAGSLRDPSGELILPTIIAMARRKGEGVHTYPWQRPGSSVVSEKMSYFRDLPQWGVVIGAGVYLDDIDAEVAGRKTEAIAELRDALDRIRIARTGYVYIFDGANTMLIHPNGNIEGAAFGTLKDPATGKSIAEELKAVADGDHPLTYLWDSPNDPGNYTYEKISWVRHFKDFDWYIASSVYVDELKRSSNLLGTRLLFTAATVMGLACFLGFVWASRLVRPINRLAETAVQVENGNLDVASGISGPDEIGTLGAAFDGMIARVRDDIATLDARVAERTRALEDAQDKVVEAQRMKAVGQMAGGLAHDFNNLLSVILGNLAIARETFAHVSGLDAYLEPAERASRRGADITGRLLAFSRSHPMLAQSVEVKGLIGEIAALVRPSLPADIDLVLPDAAQDCWALADSGQLQNAVINLALNARDAMPDGGTLTVAAGPARPEDMDGFDEPIAPGRYVRIAVADTGVGLSPDIVPRVFEPFFTTKSSGSGLGLSMVLGFVKQSRGYIRVVSTVGIGTRIDMLLPEGEAMADAGPKPIGGKGGWPGHLVLLVEDDPDVRAVLRGQLIAMGLGVIEAEGAEEALALAGMVEEIAAVVSDIAMPGMSGLDMVRTLRATKPRLPVILISGYTSDSGGDLADVVILSKPWDKADIRQALETLLGAPTGDDPGNENGTENGDLCGR